MSDDGFIRFMKHIKKSAIKRKDQKFTKKEEPNMVRKIVESLLETRGSTEDFRHNLSLVMKTGNTEDVINVIRRRLSIVGLGYNLVPCIRLVFVLGRMWDLIPCYSSDGEDVLIKTMRFTENREFGMFTIRVQILTTQGHYKTSCLYRELSQNVPSSNTTL